MSHNQYNQPNVNTPLEALQPTVFEQSRSGARGVTLPQEAEHTAVKEFLSALPAEMIRGEQPALPEMAQLDIVRHFVNLSQQNHAIDKGFYPLGSCTMKYNPKVCDTFGQIPGLTTIHPLTPDHLAQGYLRTIFELQGFLKDITGFSDVTLQPAAGAQGELVGVMMIKAYLLDKGEIRTIQNANGTEVVEGRNEIIVPDAAHGTNPATAAMCGFKVVEIPSGKDGRVNIEALKSALSDKTAGIMLTNPNTLGLFESEILTISSLVHQAGGLLYYDGANLNAILGYARPADMGFDVMHINTHKTFATPHGGGGPGCGPVCVNGKLAPYLPNPRLIEHQDGSLAWESTSDASIGRVKTFNGNMEMVVRAWMYLLAYGWDGIKAVSTDAVLNANYLRVKLTEHYETTYAGLCKHEFVINSHRQHALDKRINTLTIAKRLMDYGIHPMTMYFPLVAPEAMMIEPTETESKATLDNFIKAMVAIHQECEASPDTVASAPHTMPIKKVDEVGAARKPELRYNCCS